eukprot:12911144-Ditylum_brightwellii.AAC.1
MKALHALATTLLFSSCNGFIPNSSTRSTKTFRPSPSSIASSSNDNNNNNNQDNKSLKSSLKLTPEQETLISDFCIGTNTFWKNLVIKPVKDYVEIRPAGTAGPNLLEKLIAPPEVPGIPRPVWLTIAGSVPTALGWYGYYKFSVEEELYQYEVREGKAVTGCG